MGAATAMANMPLSALKSNSPFKAREITVPAIVRLSDKVATTNVPILAPRLDPVISP
jgi:hypothetical protein